jgi:hypothetical protein
MDSRGSVNIKNSVIDTSAVRNGNSGNISFQVMGNISLVNSWIMTTSVEQGNAGHISFKAMGDISLDNSLFKSDIGNNAQVLSTGNVGIITLDGQSISLTRTNLQAGFFTNGEGKKGLISLQGRDSILLDDSEIRGDVFFGGIGDSSDVIIKANSVSIQNNSRLIATNQGNDKIPANAGNISLNADDSITITSGVQILSNIGTIDGDPANGNVGKIQLEANNISISDSQIEVGVFKGATDTEPGLVKITADNSILFNNFNILANVEDGKQGDGSDIFLSAPSIKLVNSKLFTNSGSLSKAGNINITSDTLLLQDNSQLSSETLEEGNSGKIDINVSNKIILSGGSLIESNVQDKATGDSQGIIIQANTLSLENGSTISALTEGEGQSGEINIKADDSISLSGINELKNGSFILSDVFPTATGDSQGITIQTDTLSLDNGARISATTQGKGDAGEINITANESISLSGLDNAGFGSRILSEVSLFATGNSQGMTIQTHNLSLNDGARISASTQGEGNTGKVNITANESISLSGVDSAGFGSFIQSEVQLGATGNSQGVTVETNTLSLNEGARISATTIGKGNAGEINITANESISLSGIDDTASNSQISANTQTTGNANNITINTPQLILSEGATITAQTSSSGNSGTITIQDANIVNLGTNTNLTVETSGSGKPGNININTNTLTIGEDAQLSATATETSTNTEGGGSINLNANIINVSGELGIFAETNSVAPAGNLTINPNNTNTLDINFTDEGFISASTTAQGNGGNIDIHAPQLINISGEGTISVTTSGSGNAGIITIDSQQVKLSDGLEITASTTGNGNAGDIILKGNNLNLHNTQINAFTNSQGVAGEIKISNQDDTNANQVTLSNQSTLSTQIQANSILLDNHSLSNIEIKTDNLTVDNSTITTSTEGKGNAGNITLPNATNINLNNSEITASTSGEGDTGEIDLNASNALQLNDSDISSSVEENAVGNSQQITLNTPTLNLTNSTIEAETQGIGNAGNIETLNTQNLTLDNSIISTEIESTGIATQPSNITLNTQQLNLTNNAQITTSTSGKGNAGNIPLPNATNITIIEL